MTTEAIKFLIVDDTPENLVALEALLRRDGLEVLSARSGAEALELLLVHDVALALLDVQMPEMDGFVLAELMRGAERTKHIPIIFVTAGSRDPQRIFKGYESGAVDFLFKPIEPTVLRGKADVFFDLYHQRKALKDALSLHEMFVGILGHDLRNPLNSMLGGAQLLEAQLTDPGQLRALQRMTAAGHRMADMIEQLLDLTRIRLGGGLGSGHDHQHLDVAALVQRTVEELRGVHPGRAVAVRIQGDCACAGDEGRLLQLFSNLIANALNHGTPGHEVAISVEGGERQIVVGVHNAGAIPTSLLPTLFDPFHDRGPSSKSSGLGLGLYIARQIVLAHRGSLEVASTEAAGTWFTVCLPRAGHP